MLNLYSLFFRRLNRLLWILSLSAMALPVLASSCNTSPVFAFSRALYLEQYDTALELLAGIRRERSPEMAQFLQQVLVFKQAYETGNHAQQQLALNEIDKVITSLSGNNRGEKQLDLANIMIHTARLQLAVGHVLRAARLAKQGKQLLDKSLKKNSHNADALLANGLYHYYAGSENEALGWIMRLWSVQGDKARGREMIENSVERSADHAFEAARSLLSDVAWNRQDTCRYLSLFSALAPLETRSIMVLQEQVALLLFCGQAERSLEEIIAHEELSERTASGISSSHIDWIFEARLHALAALGDVEQLNEVLLSIRPAENLIRYRQAQFALAKGLDTRGAHENAESLYDDVASSNIGLRYRVLAQAYLQQPYQTPRPFKPKPGDRLQFACGDGKGG